MKSTSFFDRMGIFFSGLCAIHCVLVPILLIALPFIGSSNWIEHSVIHRTLFYAVFGFGVVGIYLGYRIHNELKPLMFLLIGLAIVFFGTFFAHETLGHMSEYVINPIGGMFLIWAHYTNHTRRHLAQHKACRDCSHVNQNKS